MMKSEVNQMMKKTVLLTLSLILLFCAWLPADVPLSERAKIDLVVFTWIGALKTENIDLYAETYWPDVVHTSYHPNGEVNEVFRGRKALLDAQSAAFRQSEGFADISYSDPDRDFATDPDRPVYTIVGRVGEAVWEDMFKLEKRGSQWRIIEHVFVMLP
jgi:hypothetical protein